MADGKLCEFEEVHSGSHESPKLKWNLVVTYLAPKGAGQGDEDKLRKEITRALKHYVREPEPLEPSPITAEERLALEELEKSESENETAP